MNDGVECVIQVLITLESVDEILWPLVSVTIQMKSRCLYFHVVLLVSKHFKK